ncbi:MAG: CoA transferase [Alphaproteobacteria bacterium]|jgi:crotonobetainyl-CoA:carnitine CoA-transferase CaiB-like acyl-CoA transferase|nr:CoA transferase [Alphaproteobacteria bacterium]
MSDVAGNALPLADLTILEMGSSLAGPFAGRTLAEFGATVIKVEPPEVGDASRSWGTGRIGGEATMFQAFNMGKRSLTVDFTSQDELDRLRRLVAEKIDVVFQNLRPGVVSKFGLDAKTLMAENPRLIYCNMGAFGSEGPLKHAPGYDPLMQAFAGISDATGDRQSGAARVGVPLIDVGTGMWATIGILTALHKRSVTGQGCVVDAAMLETALAWQGLNFANHQGGAGWPERMGLQGPLLVPNGGYEAADGTMVMTLGTPAQFARFCKVIEREDLLDDPRFASNDDRMANRAAFDETVNETLRGKSRAEWSELLNAADVPNAPLLDLAEAIDHAQTKATGIIQKSPAGDFELIGMPIQFDGERPAFARTAPALGEANQEVFAFMNEE